MHVIFDKQYQSFYFLTYLHNDISCNLKNCRNIYFERNYLHTIFECNIYARYVNAKNVFHSINIHENVYVYSNKTICLCRMFIRVE